MSGIDKSFGSQQVLFAVDFELESGETHVLAGENGAGKSTLIRALGGALRPDAGVIQIQGQAVRFRSPRDAGAAGVAVIHQELSLVPAMSVEDNLFLGREQTRGGWLHSGRQRREAHRVLDQIGLGEISLDHPVSAYPISVQQQIEIAKALGRAARIIVMDEPTSALNELEVECLFRTIADLKSHGCGIVYITHKLDEVYAIADRITVLRDGRRIATAPAAEMPAPSLIRNMVGRDLAEKPVQHSRMLGEERLSVEEMTVESAATPSGVALSDVSFTARAGEVVGLAGLQGSGASEALWAMFGACGRRVRGRFRVDGKPYSPRSPRDAIRRGLALLTNDRQRTGLVTGMSVVSNVSLASLPSVDRGGLISFKREAQAVRQVVQQLRLRAASLAQPVRTLSGGNQQKAVLGKWIRTRPRVLLLDEPTRGVDIGAKSEIYQLVNEWTAAGMAIVLITSEMPELLRLSDRIVVMHRGRTVAEFDRADAAPERILHAAMGGSDADRGAAA